jgi:hypothetical protein
MSRKSAVAIAALVAAAAVLTGCGPTNTPPDPGGSGTAAAPATSQPPATQAVRDLTPGNCTLYPTASATQLLGGVTANNKLLDINTDGGTKIDTCSYLNLKGLQDIEGTSYAVVRYDSAATAFAEVQKVRSSMLDSADDHDWAVQSLTAPAPGAGPLLGGFGSKTEDQYGVTYTIAVVGTNVGPYLVAALGASTENADNAKGFALKVFQALSSAVG